ncbi:RNA polymerase sigma factor [Nannocystaceae bacterium ST9]
MTSRAGPRDGPGMADPTIAPPGFPDEETLRWLEPRIAKFFRARLPGHIDPSDMVAEVMLAFANYRGEAPPKYYAFRIARNMLAQYHRQPKRIERVTTGHEFQDHQPGASTRMRRAQLEQVVRSEAAAIEEPYGGVVRLRLDGLAVREIAKELELNVNTVRSRMVRGLARLRAQLERALGSDPLG